MVLARSQPLTPAGVRGWLREITLVVHVQTIIVPRPGPSQLSFQCLIHESWETQYSRRTLTSLLFICPA